MFSSLGFLFAALSLARCAPVQQVASRSKVLLVSFDGFRWNYDQDVDTPHLDAMAAEGVKAQYMTPAFTTITSPCHFTLLTGESPAAPRQGSSTGCGLGTGTFEACASGQDPTSSSRPASAAGGEGAAELNLYLSKGNSTRPTQQPPLIR